MIYITDDSKKLFEGQEETSTSSSNLCHIPEICKSSRLANRKRQRNHTLVELYGNRTYTSHEHSYWAGLAENMKIYPFSINHVINFLSYSNKHSKRVDSPLHAVITNVPDALLMIDNVKMWSSWSTLSSLFQQNTIRTNLVAIYRVMQVTLGQLHQSRLGQWRPVFEDWLEVYRKSMRLDIDDLENVMLDVIQGLEEGELDAMFRSLPQEYCKDFLDILQSLIDRDTPAKRQLEMFLKVFVKEFSILPPYLFLTNVKRIGTNPVGGGGFSDVWKGEMGGELVALKVLRAFTGDELTTELDWILKEFCKEAMIWRQFRHRNVLPFYGVLKYEFQPLLALVAPWMSNGHLVRFLNCNADVDRVAMVLGIARGLAYLHSLKPCVVHGDLRATNILVDNVGQPRITDFGLSRILDSQASTFGRTSFKGKGSVRWQAPELLDSSNFRGELCNLTKETDVYAYAAVCLEVFSDNVPFHHLRDGQVIMEVAVARKHPPRPPQPAQRYGLDDDIWDLLSICWDYDPIRRPSMQKVVDVLAQKRPELKLTEDEDNIGFRLPKVDVLHFEDDNEEKAPLIPNPLSWSRKGTMSAIIGTEDISFEQTRRVVLQSLNME